MTYALLLGIGFAVGYAWQQSTVSRVRADLRDALRIPPVLPALPTVLRLPNPVALLQCGDDDKPQTAVLVLRQHPAIPEYRILSVHDTRDAAFVAFNAAVDASEQTVR